MVYNSGNLIFLFSRNIKTVRPSKKLNDKMLELFRILKIIKTFYRLQLPTAIRIYDVFHPSLLRKAAEDPLLG
jgi:hypothetical protein